MSNLPERIKDLSRPASSVKHTREIAYVVPRTELEELNKSLEPILRQNKAERIASEEEARNFIVK